LAPTADRPLKFRIFENQDGGGRHLENHKNLRNGLTDPYEIWYADAKWFSHPLQSLKYLNFTRPRWRTAAILKTVTSLQPFD